MELFEKLKEVYKEYEMRIEYSNDTNHFVIINPYWEENIRISNEDGIIFLFSFQHAHFDYCDNIDENIDDLIEYINTFLDGKQVVIEFLQGDINLFGGGRYLDGIDMSSGELLLKSFTGDNSLYGIIYEQIKGLHCRSAVRGWNSVSNKAIDFLL